MVLNLGSHPIEALMKTTMESLKDMVDVNTIVGDAVETPDGTTIIPISRVSFGFASGGGEYKEKSSGSEEYEDGQKFPFAGGTGAGVSVQPVAFMIVGKNNMKLLSVDQNANMFENLVALTSKLIDKASKSGDKKSKRKSESSDEEKIE
ncbi:MAG: hypothetical protein PWQ37_1838 [Candidatus Petromonas sp.]|nr:hypothetical protein [Candidatus Petromonas sp.]